MRRVVPYTQELSQCSQLGLNYQELACAPGHGVLLDIISQNTNLGHSHSVAIGRQKTRLLHNLVYTQIKK